MTRLTASIFCSSREIEIYSDMVFHTGRVLGELGFNIMYGGGHQGLMGQAEQGGIHAKTHVTGISTYHLLDKEVTTYTKGKTHFVHTMGERKDIQLKESSIVVILPGGFGTMDELFETLTYNQLDLASNDIYIFDPELGPILKDLINMMLARGTVAPKDVNRLHYVSTLKELECLIRSSEVFKGDKV